MTEVRYRSDFDVTLLDVMGSDERICQAARISTVGAAAADTAESARLLKFLLGSDHGSPFEHTAMQWMISAPIFVWREFMRHRVPWSYNEQSGRWTKLEPVFYVPDPAVRPMVKVEGSRTGDYSNRVAETDAERDSVGSFVAVLRDTQQQAYDRYEAALMTGIAKEVARDLLPVSIYSTCFVTSNVRGVMHFLNLRTHRTAQWEIRQVAEAMEQDFCREFPLTYDAYVDRQLASDHER